MSHYRDRIQWERKYYKNFTAPWHSNIIRCKLCKKTESVIIPDFIDHLRCVHGKTEILDYLNDDILLQNFTIDEEEFTAECRICDSSIDYKMYGMYLLKNHFEIYHGNSSNIYKTIVKTKSGRDTLDKYIITGSEASCPKCYLKIDMEDLDFFTEVKLQNLLEHYYCHRYKKNVLYLSKRAKINFDLLVLF